MKKNYTNEQLRELAGAATKVVAWYPHPNEVRGPYYRWFKCTDIDPQYKDCVADTRDKILKALANINGTEKKQS